jgi:V/A-type H+-transporting ATPase subunit E
LVSLFFSNAIIKPQIDHFFIEKLANYGIKGDLFFEGKFRFSGCNILVQIKERETSMAEQLQSLLEKIQSEGVDKAEAEATKIIDEAKQKASKIVDEAQQKASAIIKKAEAEGENFANRGKSALEQSARDVILSLTDTINESVQNFANKAISTTLDNSSSLEVILSKVVDAYYQGGENADVTVFVKPDLKEEIEKYFVANYGEQLKKGLKIEADDSIIAGFTVSVDNGQVNHDFTNESITEAMAELLRPQIAEIVKNVKQ